MKTSIKKNAIANYIGQFYSVVVGIITLPLYLHYLGAEAYGLIGFFTMLSAWMMLLDAGLSSTLSREAAKAGADEEKMLELKQLIRCIETVFIVIALVFIITVYCSSNFIVTHWLKISTLELSKVAICIILMGIMVVMRWFVGFYRGLLIGLEQQVWLNVYRIIIATFRFIGAFLLIKYCTDNILYFFIYQLIVGLAEYLIIILKSYRILPKTAFCLPRISPLLKIAPFALSIAYTSSIWIIFSQVDKLLLSHYIPLKQYGYFTLVTVIAGGIMQLSAPLSQAILPRMTHLLANNQQQEMLKIYKHGTQIIAVVIFSAAAIIAMFSQELLYAWTGDLNAAKWAAPVLFWYVLGNGILSVLAFQYYLQYAHGNLRYHVRFNIFFPLAVLPIIYFSIIHYGAIGAGMTLFFSQLIAFVFWPMFIHRKFAPGIHLNWMLKDIAPALLTSILYTMILHWFPINFDAMSRIEILILLIVFGIILLGIQLLFYPKLRMFRIDNGRLKKSN